MTVISNFDNRAISYQTNLDIDDTDTISNKEKPSLAEVLLATTNTKNIINNISNDELEKPVLRQPMVKSKGKDFANNVKEACEGLLTNVENGSELFNCSLLVEAKEGIASIDDNINVINRFEITLLANGYTGNQDSLLQAMLMAALSQLETRRQLANMGNSDRIRFNQVLVI